MIGTHPYKTQPREFKLQTKFNPKKLRASEEIGTFRLKKRKEQCALYSPSRFSSVGRTGPAGIDFAMTLTKRGSNHGHICTNYDRTCLE